MKLHIEIRPASVRVRCWCQGRNRRSRICVVKTCCRNGRIGENREHGHVDWAFLRFVIAAYQGKGFKIVGCASCLSTFYGLLEEGESMSLAQPPVCRKPVGWSALLGLGRTSAAFRVLVNELN
jgi:hypothetical protein